MTAIAVFEILMAPGNAGRVPQVLDPNCSISLSSMFADIKSNGDPKPEQGVAEVLSVK